MLPLLLLGLVELTTAFWPYYPGPPGPPPPPGPVGPQSPFPFQVPWEAQQELNRIQSDPNLTKQQYEDQMNQWANKYGVKDKYDAYKKNIDDQRTKAQQELDEALKALPKYYRQLRKIENDNTLTRAQAAQKKQELLNTLTPKQKRAAQFLENLFAPDYAKRPSPGPMRPGPYGPGPYGPGPYGPRPGPYRPYGPYGYCT